MEQLQNFKIAQFAHRIQYKDLNENITDQLKRHLLDSLASLFHATQRPAIHKLVKQLQLLGEGGHCNVPLVERLPMDRAAQLYTALIRYPDFMDNYLGKDSTCHPCDNIGSLLAASQYRPTSGKDFLRSMAISYQLQCRLIEEIPVMTEGIDHTLLLSYSIVAGIAQLLELTIEQTAHALAIAGCSISPLATSRASYTYEWKGFASSLDALTCINIALLAKQGMTGPLALFEGPKGFKEIFNMKLDYDWEHENLSLIPRCILKKYNAEVHSQAVLEAIYQLQQDHSIRVDAIKKIDITTFLTSYNIIGSGSYGDRQKVASKEQADHSLFYLAAVLLLDGEIYPSQFEPDRINRPDVQQLLQKVEVRTGLPVHKPMKLVETIDPYTARYPEKMRSKVEITFEDGRQIVQEQEDYPGFYTRPMDWQQVVKKFHKLTADAISEKRRQQVLAVVQDLENREMTDLLQLVNNPDH
ncbi:MmgE/PrpD family protein [Chitinophaga agrisoli]|uniref:MmgE/PrpD family protein n=1 Tax=Chitinophaga agrisoli TaxID=2607653 RepID=A0A5B2VUC8_9BACT|nr:MmgE/PrpD family protein [Chitinophaga agrisoli]KAA2242655.1 MmgE/PrpD family protein [Chitinophaga agrisoli]